MKINTMKLKLTALLLVLYTGLYAQNKIVLTAPRLDTSSLSNRINLKANTSLNNVNGVLSSTYGGAGSVNGILKADGSGVVSPVIASDITTLISGTYLPLSGGTLTGALNGTSLSMSGAASVGSISQGSNFRTSGQLFDFQNSYIRIRDNAGTATYGVIGRTSFIEGGSGTELGFFAETGLGINLYSGGSSTVRVRVSPAGNTLIKTTTESPNREALQVNGSIKVTNGGIDVDDATSIIRANNFRIAGTDRKIQVWNSVSAYIDALSFATTGAITASSSVTANSFVTTGSVRTTNPSNASYYGLFSNDGAMVFDAYGAGTFSLFKVNGTAVLSVDASGAVISGTSRANGYRFAYSTKSSNYTLTNNDDYIVVTNASTITLPTAVGRAGKRYVIRSTAGSGVSSSLTTTSSQTIDGILPFPSPFSFGFGNYNIIIVFSDGANWFSETFITGG